MRTEAPATWVFWVHASNEARFKESFRIIANRLRIPGRRDPNINILELVENWLQDERKGKWICILDNADDDKFLCSRSATGKALLEHIPRSQNGSTIITSRSREVALKMVNFEDVIEVSPMENSEALELLRKVLDQPEGNPESEQLVEVEQLVEELELMPLAIVQAGSFIRERGSRYSVTRYVQDFRENDREATKLLKKEPGHMNRDPEATNSILMTWQISFEHIHCTKRSAADLLSLMSLFDRQAIPYYLIKLQRKAGHTFNSEASQSSDEDTSESDEEPDLEDDIATLRNYSVISISNDGTFFTMHRLVQLTMWAWLKSHKQIDRWREKLTSILDQEFPTIEYENWGKCQALLPHIRSAMTQRPKTQNSLIQWTSTIHRG